MTGISLHMQWPLTLHTVTWQWVIVYFGQCFENFRSRRHFWSTFFNGMYRFWQKWAGLLFGRFSTNSSDHPVRKVFFSDILRLKCDSQNCEEFFVAKPSQN
jgi:hypothetical protein